MSNWTVYFNHDFEWIIAQNRDGRTKAQFIKDAVRFYLLHYHEDSELEERIAKKLQEKLDNETEPGLTLEEEHLYAMFDHANEQIELDKKSDWEIKAKAYEDSLRDS